MKSTSVLRIPDLIFSYLKEKGYKALPPSGAVYPVILVGEADIVVEDLVTVFEASETFPTTKLDIHSPSFFEDLERTIKEINGQA